MKDQARVVVIGGGIVGCSVLYNLAKLGWSDVVLVEKIELTAGSTWHATGLLPLFNMGYSVGQLHKYSIDLYQQLEEETGQAVSFTAPATSASPPIRSGWTSTLRCCSAGRGGLQPPPHPGPLRPQGRRGRVGSCTTVPPPPFRGRGTGAGSG